MLFTRTRSLMQRPAKRLDRARELVRYLEQAADLADLTSQIVGELEVNAYDQVVSRDHAIAARSAVVAMLEDAIAEVCEMEGLSNDYRNRDEAPDGPCPVGGAESGPPPGRGVPADLAESTA